jgi:hypothetical protein
MMAFEEVWDRRARRKKPAVPCRGIEIVAGNFTGQPAQRFDPRENGSGPATLARA